MNGDEWTAAPSTLSGNRRERRRTRQLGGIGREQEATGDRLVDGGHPLVHEVRLVGYSPTSCSVVKGVVLPDSRQKPGPSFRPSSLAIGASTWGERTPPSALPRVLHEPEHLDRTVAVTVVVEARDRGVQVGV